MRPLAPVAAGLDLEEPADRAIAHAATGGGGPREDLRQEHHGCEEQVAVSRVRNVSSAAAMPVTAAPAPHHPCTWVTVRSIATAQADVPTRTRRSRCRRRVAASRSSCRASASAVGRMEPPAGESWPGAVPAPGESGCRRLKRVGESDPLERFNDDAALGKYAARSFRGPIQPRRRDLRREQRRQQLSMARSSCLGHEHDHADLEQFCPRAPQLNMPRPPDPSPTPRHRWTADPRLTLSEHNTSLHVRTQTAKRR